MIKAVIFDLDDTLYPEKDYTLSGLKSVAKYISEKCNLDFADVYKTLRKLHEGKPENVFNRLLEDYRYGDFSVLELIDVYRNHIPKIKLYDDVVPVVESLIKAGYKIGLITDGYKVTQRNKILGLDIERYFEEIIITDELGREYWKPHSKSFEIMKDNFQVDFNQMIYIGDNPKKDFYIGSIYPIKTVRIDRGGYYSQENYHFGIEENFTINGLFELQDAISDFDNMEGE